MRKRQLLAIPALLLALSGLAACGGGSDGSDVASAGDAKSSAQSTASQPSAQAFSQCMRDNGVPDYPDWGPDGPPKGKISPAEAQSPAFQSAMNACKNLVPSDIRKGSESDKDLGTLQKFAQCMRDNGMPDFPDPKPGSDGPFSGSDVDRGSPAYQKASQACKDELS